MRDPSGVAPGFQPVGEAPRVGTGADIAGEDGGQAEPPTGRDGCAVAVRVARDEAGNAQGVLVYRRARFEFGCPEIAEGVGAGGTRDRSAAEFALALLAAEPRQGVIDDRPGMARELGHDHRSD